MAEIKLTKGEICLVDEDDYYWLRQWEWWLSPAGYAVRSKRNMKAQLGGSQIQMHRIIMRVHGDNTITVDHVNHNKLDNRKSNLRLASTKQQNFNRRSKKGSSSGYKGVCWEGKANRWRVAIGQTYIGLFINEKEAAREYDRAAMERYGRFAFLNLPESREEAEQKAFDPCI